MSIQRPEVENYFFVRDGLSRRNIEFHLYSKTFFRLFLEWICLCWYIRIYFQTNQQQHHRINYISFLLCFEYFCLIFIERNWNWKITIYSKNDGKGRGRIRPEICPFSKLYDSSIIWAEFNADLFGIISQSIR
jgi:hypothetical protein